LLQPFPLEAYDKSMLQMQCRNAACISICDIVQLFVHETLQNLRDARTVGK